MMQKKRGKKQAGDIFFFCICFHLRSSGKDTRTFATTANAINWLTNDNVPKTCVNNPEIENVKTFRHLKSVFTV